MSETDRARLDAWIEDVIGQTVADANIVTIQLDVNVLVIQQLVRGEDGHYQLNADRDGPVLATARFPLVAPPPVWPPAL